MTQYSLAKTISFKLFDKIDRLAQPHIKHATVKWFWNKFFVSHGKNAIIKTPDSELKKILLEAYQEIDPIATDLQMGIEIAKAKKTFGKDLVSLDKLPKGDEIKEIVSLVEDIL